MSFHDRPCAASGLTSYRYKGRFGWIMIGAKDDTDALREASRSTTPYPVNREHLEIWNGEKYVGVAANA